MTKWSLISTTIFLTIGLFSKTNATALEVLFTNNNFNVRAFGALGDGKNLDSQPLAVLLTLLPKPVEVLCWFRLEHI